MGLSGFSGATAVCAPARLTTLADSKPATNQNFMDPPLYHATTSIDQIGNPRQSVDALPVLLLAINLQAFFTPLLAPHGQFGTVGLIFQQRNAIAAGIADAVEFDHDDRSRPLIDWKAGLQAGEFRLVRFDH